GLFNMVVKFIFFFFFFFAISFCFPLTYALQLVRRLLMEGAPLSALAPELALLASVLLLLVLVTVVLLKKAEKHMKETGNMVMY
ncbi:hypothetical protein EN829_044435, partial [Mesorhizobium sp. M00.F.Ca.ET.186.01.1.1]